MNYNHNQLQTNNNKHQNISNSSSANGSIRKAHIDITNSSSLNNPNNSTRSLKRTSTGVSRRYIVIFKHFNLFFKFTNSMFFFVFSSSVRRTSFRDKEKAARKLDTSFKDVLYAQNTHSDLKEELNPSLSQLQPTQQNTTVVKIINNKIINNNNNELGLNTNNNDNNNKSPLRTNNLENNESTLNNFGNKSKAFVDDHNNNQLNIIRVSQELFRIITNYFSDIGSFIQVESTEVIQIQNLTQIYKNLEYNKTMEGST